MTYVWSVPKGAKGAVCPKVLGFRMNKDGTMKKGKNGGGISFWRKGKCGRSGSVTVAWGPVLAVATVKAKSKSGDRRVEYVWVH